MNLNRPLQMRRQRQRRARFDRAEPAATNAKATATANSRRGGGLITDCADSTDMYSSTRGVSEPRKAMMAVAKVTWEDQYETVHTAPARLEDTSASGACFRVKVPIEAGTRVRVSWCRDDFSGTTRWCRAADGEYVMGMRRDEVARTAPDRTVKRVQAASGREAEMTAATAAVVASEQSIPRQRQVIRRGRCVPFRDRSRLRWCA